MTHVKPSLASIALALAALLLGAAALPAMAASSTASAASDSLTTSVGSASGSIQKSSDSSSTDNKVADGDYKIIDVATLAERPGTLRMKLQAVADRGADGEFFLYLPQPAFEQSRLAQGDIVSARQRPYGLEFAHGQTRQAFFLVLSDDWYRELNTTAVVL
jgi:hypothetical protein